MVPDKHAAIEAALAIAGHGAVLDWAGLNGEILVGAGRSSASLCRTPLGLWLVALPAGAEPPAVIDLLAPERTVRYRQSMLGDRLEVDAERLGIPRGRAERVQDVIAFARITRYFGTATGVSVEPRADSAHAWSGPLVESLGARERHWLRSWLGGERLLAWFDSDDVHRFVSRFAGDIVSTITFVVTDTRQALVAISPLGDVWVDELPDEPLVIEPQIGRDLVRIGERELRTTLMNEGGFRAIASLSGSTGIERLRGHALALWRFARKGDQDLKDRVGHALAPLTDDPLSVLALRLVVDPGIGDLPETVFAALRRLAADPDPDSRGRELIEWWLAWQVGPEIGEVLVEHLCELGRSGQQVALPLHERVRPALQAVLGEDPEAAALLDFVLVEHLLSLGEHNHRACELLEKRRASLPSEDLQDLLPASPERGGQTIRIELHELLAEAHRQGGRPAEELAALAELARLQPLAREHLVALIDRLPVELNDSTLSLRARASRIRELLDENAFGTAETYVAEPGKIEAIRDADLELLRHPAARADGVFGRLQGALAKVAVPDCTVLKNYCARANLSREQALATAVTDATVMLGIVAIEVFVSRGDKSVGLRAYEATTPFMLIGGDHLDPDSDAFLNPVALRHAVTAELAHLRFAHSRVTSDEVWAGTLDLGLTGLGVLIVAAPLLKAFQAPAKHILDKIGAPALARWRKKLSDTKGARALGSENSELIAAHRVMQLTADRAGLLACGDPRASIEAMFHSHPSHLSQWPLVVRRGLRDSLIRETRSDDERDRARLEDLAVRVAALSSFYLSDDFVRLHSAAWQTRGGVPQLE